MKNPNPTSTQNLVRELTRNLTPVRRQPRLRVSALAIVALAGVGFVYVLNKYGPGFVDQLLDQLPLDVGRHWVVTV